MAELNMSGTMSNEEGKKHRQTQSLILITYVTVEQLKLDRFKIIVHLEIIIVIISQSFQTWFSFFSGTKGQILMNVLAPFPVLLRLTGAFRLLKEPKVPHNYKSMIKSVVLHLCTNRSCESDLFNELVDELVTKPF